MSNREVEQPSLKTKFIHRASIRATSGKMFIYTSSMKGVWPVDISTLTLPTHSMNTLRAPRSLMTDPCPVNGTPEQSRNRARILPGVKPNVLAHSHLHA